MIYDFTPMLVGRLLTLAMAWACLLNQLHMCSSFSTTPMIITSSTPQHRQYPVLLFANPPSTKKTSDEQPTGTSRRTSKRRRVINALKSTPKATKRLVSVLGLSFALWRGGPHNSMMMVQPSHAASTKNARSAPAIVSPLKVVVLGTPVPLKQRTVALTTGSGAIILTGARVAKKRWQDPERSRSRRRRKEQAEKLKKLRRLTQIRQELEFLLEDATHTNLPLMDEKFVEARRQPKSPEEEDFLAMKYAAIKSLADRAYQILLDLGMIEESYVVDLDIIWKLLNS